MFLHRLCGVLVFVFILACAIDPVFAAEVTTGSIVGNVVDAGGAPVPHAHVSAAAPAGRYSTTSDARGRFVILGMAPDTYVLSIDAPGFGTLTQIGVVVGASEAQQMTYHLQHELRTIGDVRSSCWR
jgi:hypothetical protein